MIRTSSVPVVKARLVELITAALATAGRDNDEVQTSYGWPQNQQRECVIVGELAQPAEQAWTALGARTRDERYDLQIDVLVRDPRNETQQAATERAFELLALIEDTLREDPSLGLAAARKLRYLECEVTTATLREAPSPDGEGYWAAVGWVLRVARARIGGPE